MESVSTGAGRASPSPQEALKDAFVVDTQQVRSHLDEVVRSTVEQTLNQVLDEEADRVALAARYERSEERVDTRAGSYRRDQQTKARELEPTVPRQGRRIGEADVIERSTCGVSSKLVPFVCGGLGRTRATSPTARTGLGNLLSWMQQSIGVGSSAASSSGPAEEHPHLLARRNARVAAQAPWARQ